MKLFIDDERFPPDDGADWHIVRSSKEAIDYVSENGFPDFISFDHDLGGQDTSMVFLHAVSDSILEFDSMPFAYYVHSQNPIGVANIHGLLNSLAKFQRNKCCKDWQNAV